MSSLVAAEAIFFFWLVLSSLIDDGHSYIPNCWNTSELTWLNSSNDSYGDNTKIVFALHLTPENISIANHSDICITGVIECSNEVQIIFMNINNLHLENLQIRNCYVPTFARGVYITHCTNVTIKNITIENSRGTGLVLEDNAGSIIIENSTFQSNGLDYTQDSVHNHIESVYNLEKFEGKGGGLQVLIGGNVSNSSLKIKDCLFMKNSALLNGGGLLVIIQQKASGNTIEVINSNFIDNECHNGGGGLQIGYVIQSHSKEAMDNSVHVQDCTFSNNCALYGGGTAIFANQGSQEFSVRNRLEFTNCSWTNNTAELGMAVDIAIAPWETFTRVGLFPSPMFTDCTLTKHSFSADVTSTRPKNVLSVTGFRLKFRGNTTFEDNNTTAIEATSAELDFAVNSSAKFINNQGVFGGAMKLNGLTVLFVRSNSEFVFEKNTADFGGAIYVESYKHSLIPSKSCFIQYNKSHTEKSDAERIPEFVLTDNTAGTTCRDMANNCTDLNNTQYRGHFLYATTIEPCIRVCLKQYKSNFHLSIYEALNCIGKFTYDKTSKGLLCTAAHHFAHSETKSKDDPMCQFYLNLTDQTLHVNKNYTEKRTNSFEELKFVPGKVTKLPLKLIDDLCEETFFHVTVKVTNSKTIIPDPAFTVITSNSIALRGRPHDSGTLQLSTIGVRNEAIQINVVMDECPPGYVLQNDNTCICSSLTQNQHYVGIERCNKSLFRAYVKHGYWVGYVNNGTATEKRLASAICPRGFCTKITHWLWKDLGIKTNADAWFCSESYCNYTTDQSQEHLLPSNRSENLDNATCNPSRKGKVCGVCIANHSATYRSTSFSCKPETLCFLGWLFYILTELVPVTILFLVVIFFNISFTSGPLNGVVFFMQVVDTMKLDAENFIKIDSTVHTFARLYKLVYRIFTLRIFALEEFSFCLWQGASALDMLAFRYVTVIYSLFLVIATVLSLKVCDFCGRRMVINLKHSIIHGLSAFIVMTYSESTRVSLMILAMSTLRVGPENNRTPFQVAFYNGNFSYMEQEHLTYAIPAIFFLITLVSIPPLLLLSYPLCYKLFALLRIEESRFVQITCKIFPLEKIKPLFDSIQGTFIDRYRFFAGMYFVYRLSLLLTFTYADTLLMYYTITGAQLMGMLVLHAVCRPYKKTWHNILDALLFSNLAIINTLTFYMYELISPNKDENTANATVQTALVSLPLVYLASYTVYHIVKRIKAVCVHKSSAHYIEETDNSNEVIDNLDTRDFDDSCMEMNEYRLLGPEPRVNQK